MKPTIGVMIGDASGIGPELAARLLTDPQTFAMANVLVIGDRRILAAGAAVAGVDLDIPLVDGIQRLDFSQHNPLLYDIPTLAPEEVPVGEVYEPCGAAVLKNYKTALQLARSKTIDGFCFTPLNKAAMKLAGNPCEDELQLAAKELAYEQPVSEFNVLNEMWNARVTSHIPLKDVAAQLSIDRIVTAIRLAHEALLAAGFEHPRIAVAALNPHAGDSGNIGREEIDIIEPAVKAAQALQIPAEGPFPGDTLYLKIRDNEYNCAVTMYHDQGQTAIKLLGFDKGVTILGGLPFPVTTPAHGTAFDIAGRGIANPEATRQAFAMVCRMASRQ